MRIGLDFDNTIVNYDLLFHKVAVEKGVLPPSIPPNKTAVRNYLRESGQESLWTEMQGVVYGERMAEANAYLGAFDFMRRANSAGHSLTIVSHKTKHPFIGPKHDLHLAARNWVDLHLESEGHPLISPENIYFELTKAAKILRIRKLGCETYLDDLPEILLDPEFPDSTRRILFDPHSKSKDSNNASYSVIKSWGELEQHLIG